MHRGYPFILSVFFCLVAYTTSAQFASNLHAKKIPAKGKVSLDSLSIVPKTLLVKDIDSSFYTIDYINAVLVWKKAIAADSVWVSYRVFPLRLNRYSRRFDYDSIINISITDRQITRKNGYEDNAGIFNFGNIDYNGSFGRSMSFGNSQDAVFNSQFNLQMSGYIGDSIQIAAAITDNNIPLQPDGTTQQLNEFDKILLQFRKRNWEVDLGDVDLRQTDNYFLNFYKRLQGITYSQTVNIGPHVTNKTIASGAIAKGKFARNVLAVTEGNQGPYRLQGNNNELYFVVLAGTEKVFMDGVQLQRGEDQDYTIDYNTAQVTFTSKNLISADKRIQVEFEYADRNYLNSMLYVNNETQIGKKLKINVAAYSNADSKNSPINQTLDNPQKQFLADLGDSINQAYYQVASIDTFDAAKIMYRKTDTLVNGIHDSVFVYSTDPANAKYTLSFVQVGANKGNYIALASNANGNVYQWVAPVDGVAQGSYEPAEFLVTPKKQQIVTIGTRYQINDKNFVQVQLAGSRYDVNTFSEKDKGNDDGHAAKINYDHTEKWQTHTGKNYQFNMNAGYDWVDGRFQPIERLRPVEFARDWGLSILPGQASEKLSSLSLSVKDDKKGQLNYQFGSYIRGDGYKGYRNILQHSQSLSSGWQFSEALSLTNMNTPVDKGYYFRPSFDISRELTHFHHYVIGAGYLREENKTRDKFSDTLNAVSYAFETITAYLRSDASKPNNWAFSFYTRKDMLPDSNRLSQTTRSNNFTLSGQLYSNEHHQFKLNMTYRQLFVQNSLLVTGTQPDKTLLGRLEYAVNEWKGLLTGNALYEIGAGQEQKLNYSYVEVQAGQGQYTWKDYNNDGIAQLNEFEVAVFKDQANYIRLFTPTDEYVKANYTQLNYSIMLSPKAVTSDAEKGWKNILGRLNLQSSLQANTKQVAKGGPVFNPFQRSVSDTALLQLNYIFSNTFSFNRSSTKWGFDITNLLNYDKSLLSYGSESRQQNEWNIKGRLNLWRTYTLELVQRKGINNMLNPSYDNRNYHINWYSTAPALTYTLSTRFRMQVGYLYSIQKNSMEYGGEKSTSNALNIESKLNAVQNTSLSGKFTYNKITYTGDANSTIGYTILNGLQPGNNFLWTLDLTKRLMHNLELSFQYEGRKAGDARMIHIGRMSIKAVL